MKAFPPSLLKNFYLQETYIPYFSKICNATTNFQCIQMWFMTDRAQARNETPAVTQQRLRPVPMSGQATGAGSRAMPELSRIDDHHGEDQVRTFCTEGTPMNYLSTATSMNELNKVLWVV